MGELDIDEAVKPIEPRTAQTERRTNGKARENTKANEIQEGNVRAEQEPIRLVLIAERNVI